jgi:shikimate dehydrogenase
MGHKNNLIAGVMGNPISHSKSPLLFRHWLNELKIQGQYVALKVVKEDLEQVLETLPKIGFSGINVTIPHKEHVLKFCRKNNT